MLRASSAHLLEDTVVHMQHMVLSLYMRVPGGLSVDSLIENPTISFWRWAFEARNIYRRILFYE